MGVKIPFRRELEFTYRQIEQVAPGIRRLVAENPSPFTLHGTGTYIIGEGEVAIIDPGPRDPAHIDALFDGLGDEVITHVLVTHTHMDHSPGCELVRERCPAKTYAFGPHGAGKLADGVQVEEGGDMAFAPDVLVKDGDLIEGKGFTIECVYTPGHTSNHLCFQYVEQQALFTGDHVMGWSTSIISPPDGDMGAYLGSLEKLLERNDRVYWPTHGPCIDEPKAFVQKFIEHRLEREAQIKAALGRGLTTIERMVPEMYEGLPEFMYPAAARSVWAAIEHLLNKGEVVTDGAVTLDATYRLPT